MTPPLFCYQEKCQIFYNDCIIQMKQMQNDNLVINHIITDPPYAISKDNNFHTMNNPRKGVDFGAWDKDFDLSLWLDYAYPLLDKDGSMVIFCSYRFISYITQKIETLGGVVKDIMDWQKQNPMPRNINRRYVQDMEFMIWIVKSKNSKWIFNKPDDKPYQRGFFSNANFTRQRKHNSPNPKTN